MARFWTGMKFSKKVIFDKECELSRKKTDRVGLNFACRSQRHLQIWKMKWDPLKSPIQKKNSGRKFRSFPQYKVKQSTNRHKNWLETHRVDLNMVTASLELLICVITPKIKTIHSFLLTIFDSRLVNLSECKKILFEFLTRKNTRSTKIGVKWIVCIITINFFGKLAPTHPELTQRSFKGLKRFYVPTVI